MENQRGTGNGDGNESTISPPNISNSSETNLELSRKFYNQALYKTVDKLIKTYGKNIHQDLCFLLRQLIVSRIAYQRYVERDILQLGGVNVHLEIELDPYEALDLFISRPRSHSHRPNIFGFLVSGWELKYGNQIKEDLAKLEQAYQRLFFYQAQKIYSYVEAAFGTKLELHKSFAKPELILEKLSSTSMDSSEFTEEQEDSPLAEEVDKLLTKDFYIERYRKKFHELSKKLYPEECDELKELLALAGRIEEFNMQYSLTTIASTAEASIQQRFGSQYQTKLSVQYSYLDSNVNKADEDKIMPCNRNSILVEFMIMEGDEK